MRGQLGTSMISSRLLAEPYLEAGGNQAAYIALTNCEIGTSKIFVKVGLFELGMGKSFLSLVPDTREVRQCPERLRAGLL